MALQKQIITIPLGLGVNTKADPKLLEAGAFNLISENATFEKVGAVKKRDGYVSLSNEAYDPTLSAGSIPENYSTDAYPPVSVSTLGKGILLRNQLGEYYFKHKDVFIKKDKQPVPECKVTSELIFSGNTAVSLTDTCYDEDENIIISVARDGNLTGEFKTINGQGSTLVIYDLNTKTTITTDQASATVSPTNNFGFVKCGFSRSGSSYYYNVFVDSDNTLKIWTFNKLGQKYASVVSISGIQTRTIAPTYGSIASCASSDKSSCFFMVPTTTASTAKFIAMSGPTKTFETTFAITGSSFYGAYAYYVSGLIHLYYSDGSSIRLVKLNPDGTVNTATASYVPAGGPSVVGDQDNDGDLFFSSAGSVEYSFYNGAISTIQNRSILASDKVNIGGVDIIIVSDSLNDVANTYYALGVSLDAGYAGSKVVARLSPGTAVESNGTDSIWSQYQPTRIAKISNTMAAVALPRLTGNNGDVSYYGMQLVFFEINADHTSYNRATLGTNLHFQGGYLSEFDGENLFENGFLGGQNAPDLNTASAGTLTGTFSYITVMKYIDKNGQITRSSPSLSKTTGAISAKKVIITPGVSPYGVKAKSCIVEFYRTTNGGSTFYYIGELLVDMYGTIPTFEDQISDINIADNTILYTSGGVLENNPAPSNKSAIQGGNRMFLIGLEDENEAAYSKKKLFGECVNFSDFFRIRFDLSQYNTSGGLTAQGYMDDKYIAFKKNSIFYVSGDGPNELGNNDTFSSPELISSETGCTDPRSVVLTPEGLMFKGEKGIYLLNRGLGTNYIGAPVEEFNQYNISSAVHLDDRNQVVFTLVGDDNSTHKNILVYDYFTKQWAVNTGYAAIDSDISDGKHIILDDESRTPLIQNRNSFMDDSTGYPVKIVTPWIKVSGIQDFGRIWKAVILGKFKSDHQLIVKAYYDYSDDYVETFTITPLDSDAQYQYECKLIKQKCESIKFEIYDSSIAGESMELTALTLEVGLKRGSMKLASTRKH